ncbi:Aste57867_21913 [Aphanomyces stellatus]|uniref:Aste57867_21913 protein n=1 Tax=Aphanomyces stellatus TaxID=120398 RepID=A0A485LK55_9STRA|nr:hypothetical protein As57867_021844 [Aphanomyces stellatus]VFT98581.1 Aste57867_21913 [Aphanomyces stellatus]
MRDDRGARFEVDVADEDPHALLETPVAGTVSVAVPDNVYVTGSTPTEPRWTEVNTRFSMRPTVFERPSDEDTNTQTSRQHMVLTAATVPVKGERTKDYRGRIRVWPGLLLLLAIVAVASAGIVLGAHKSYKQSNERALNVQTKLAQKRAIQDGLSSGDVDVADDGLVNNPRTYPPKKCSLPNYVSKNGQIIAISPNGTQVAVGIKGVNWFGMETKNAVPFGLWQNDQNGTTVFDIASFLQRHKFNSVRLPISLWHVLENTPPKEGLVNLQTNRAMNLKNYMTTLQSIIQALAYRKITVLLSFHTFAPDDNESGLWYDRNVPETSVLKAIDILTTNLCKDDYWNVIGIDLKNEPHKATWGDGVAATDWSIGAATLGNQMLKGCPNWVGFVEGIYGGKNTGTIDGQEYAYFNWWGGGLQGAATKGVSFTTANKVVYAPHYYTTAVSPQDYFYGGKTWKDMIELPDDRLRTRVSDSMGIMFGFLAGKNEAIVLGEFGGLYAKDKHPQKTTKRTTDFTIEVIVRDKYAGGYMWSMNPESAYQYNPITAGTYTEGLLADDWLTPNTEFLSGMDALNSLPNIKDFPCFYDKA